MTTLSATELDKLAGAAFGPQWQSALARDRGVSVRTVQRWARDGIAKPETAEAIHAYLTTRTVVSLPFKSERKLSRYILNTAMDDVVAEITQAGAAGGWTERETQRALMHALMATQSNWKRPIDRRRDASLTYEPGENPFLIEGRKWKVGSDFDFIGVRVVDRSLRSTAFRDEERSQALAQIRERADDFASHSSRSAAYVLGVLMSDQSSDPVEMMHRVTSLMEQAQSEEEQASLERILDGRATQSDCEAAMKSAVREQ